MGLAGDRHLKMALEASDRTRSVRESQDQVTKREGGRQMIGFSRWRDDLLELRPDVGGEFLPSDQPTAGAAERKLQGRSLPRGMLGSCGCRRPQQGEEMAGHQRAEGNDGLPIDGECTSTP